MIVKDLIIELLEYEMDQEVEIQVVTDEETETISDFVIEENGYSKRWVNIAVKPDGYVLVEEKVYETLKDEKSDLEDKVEQLENSLSDYEQTIFLLEGE